MLYVCFIMLPLPRPTLFPYTTLFRSRERLRARHGFDARQGLGRGLLHGLLHGLAERLRPAEVETLTERHVELARSEEHTSELQSQSNLVCRLLLEKKNFYVATYVNTK